MATPKSAYVLIVDDDHFIRDALEEILVDEGYVVGVAADGRVFTSKTGQRGACDDPRVHHDRGRSLNSPPDQRFGNSSQASRS